MNITNIEIETALVECGYSKEVDYYFDGEDEQSYDLWTKGDYCSVSIKFSDQIEDIVRDLHRVCGVDGVYHFKKENVVFASIPYSLNDLIIDLKSWSQESKYMNKKCNHLYKTSTGVCYSCIRIKQQLEDPSLLIKRKEWANIKKKFFNVNFEIFLDNCQNSELRKIAEEIRDYDLSHNILMIGNTGSGKTHLAIAALINAIKNGFSGYYIKFYEITQLQINNPDKFNKICDVDFLIIDEFGVGKSNYKSDLLFQIMDSRYDNEQPTIIISNLLHEQVKDCMTEATYSRIVEKGEAYSFDFDDYRVKNK